MPKLQSDTLRRKLRRLRTNPARGIKAKGKPVEEDGGDNDAGLIRGAAIVTRGEALGHGYWLDGDFLQQTAEAVNGSAAGAKARFTHPSLSGDGLGSFLGRVKNATIDGDVVRGDLHFSEMAHETPDGDLAGYVMGLAKADPEVFGVSISYMPDYGAQDKHRANHEHEEGKFRSPDAGNEDNLPHARLFELRAADVVDDPAANPDGLFQRGQEFAAEADELFAYTLGLSQQTPELVELNVDPDRVSHFVHRFLDRYGLEITTRKQEDAMSTDTDTPDEKPADQDDQKSEKTKQEPAADQEKQPADEAAEEKLAVTITDEDLRRHNEVAEAGLRSECKQFVEAFGGCKGGQWYADGLSFDEAKDRYIAELEAEKEQLQAKLKVVDRGEDKAADFQTGSEEQEQGKAALQTTENYGDGLAPLVAFNAAKLPSRN